MAVISESTFLANQRDVLLAEIGERRAFAQRARADAESLLDATTVLDTQFDEESAEGDTTVVERDQLLVLAAEADAAAEAAEAAVVRIDASEYGECQACGEEINPERLEALPAATLCVTCKAGRDFY
jgi:DnaK suppressor protein